MGFPVEDGGGWALGLVGLEKRGIWGMLALS